ncbi:unnamed protein product, partial [Commensalibacter communis]
KFKTNTLPAYPLLILFTFQRTHNPQHKSRKLQPNTVINQTQEVFSNHRSGKNTSIQIE